MSDQLRRRLVMGTAAVAAAVLGWNLLSFEDAAAPASTSLEAPIASASPLDHPSPEPFATGQGVLGSDTRTYALRVSDLAGLPPDAPPGTQLELWVAWEPPMTKQPRIQRLVRRVVLQRIVPPVAVGGEPTALLEVRASDLPDVLWGDRYGQFSVAVSRGA